MKVEKRGNSGGTVLFADIQCPQCCRTYVSQRKNMRNQAFDTNCIIFKIFFETVTVELKVLYIKVVEMTMHSGHTTVCVTSNKFQINDVT